MLLSDYTYNLPKTSIAQHPPEKRGEARLLVMDKSTGQIADQYYADLVQYINSGDVLVLNDTKVIKARLSALDNQGKSVELILLERHAKAENVHQHKVLFRGKLQVGDELSVGSSMLTVEAIEDNGIAVISSPHDIEQLANSEGKVPLPPYMKRDANSQDEARYQTVFALAEGSVAAPTASLNMTMELIEKLEAKGVQLCYVTLHVGLGTFLPIRSESIEGHTMHSEYYEIPAETIVKIRKTKEVGGRVVALGTTAARTLEYAADQIMNDLGSINPENLSGEADIFIYPGYKFKLVDGLLTNFHAPKSTVLMLAAAFVGWDRLKRGYDHALGMGYQFLSYGDSMLLI